MHFLLKKDVVVKQNSGREGSEVCMLVRRSMLLREGSEMTFGVRGEVLF